MSLQLQEKIKGKSYFTVGIQQLGHIAIDAIDAAMA